MFTSAFAATAQPSTFRNTTSENIKSRYVSEIVVEKNYCDGTNPNPGPRGLGVVVPFLGIALKSVVSIFLEDVDSKIKRELAAYQHSEDFRLELENIKNFGCVKIRRGIKIIEGDEAGKIVKPNLDIQYNIISDDSHSLYTAFQLQPYKLEARKEVNKGARGDIIAFTNSVTAKSFLADTSRDVLYVNASSNESEVLLTGRFTSTKDLVEPLKPTTKINPSQPVFRVLKNQGKALPVTIVFTHTEVGRDKKKDKLKYWERFLSKSSDNLNDAFTSAILKLLEPEDQATASGD